MVLGIYICVGTFVVLLWMFPFDLCPLTPLTSPFLHPSVAPSLHLLSTSSHVFPSLPSSSSSHPLSCSFQERKLYEKIGEPTEVALKVLAEKLNIVDLDRSSMSGQQKASSCLKASQQEFNKEFTLEFSRDRKSMSVYCRPKGEPSKPLMFVKVRREKEREREQAIINKQC